MAMVIPSSMISMAACSVTTRFIRLGLDIFELPMNAKERQFNN